MVVRSSQLYPVDAIVAFSGDEGLGEVRTRMPVAVRVSLEEDDVRSIFGSVHGNSEWF